MLEGEGVSEDHVLDLKHTELPVVLPVVVAVGRDSLASPESDRNLCVWLVG